MDAFKISKERANELQDKVRFVQMLNEAFNNPMTKKYSSVEEIRYDVFAIPDYGIQEYAVVTYYGGAIAVANCSGNSLSTIFRAFGKMLDGGYYDEVEVYKRKLANKTEIEVI